MMFSLTTLLSLISFATSLPHNAPAQTDIENLTLSNITSHVVPRQVGQIEWLNGKNNALCLYGHDHKSRHVKRWQWMVWADGPWAQGRWLRATWDNEMIYHPRTYVDVLGERFLSRIHQKCGHTPTHRFRYGDITNGTWNNTLYDGGPGLMQFTTLKPTNPHCVEGTIWELSREYEGVVNNFLGTICHKIDNLEPDKPWEMFNAAMGFAEGDGCALEQVGRQCCELSFKECLEISGPLTLGTPLHL